MKSAPLSARERKKKEKMRKTASIRVNFGGSTEKRLMRKRSRRGETCSRYKEGKGEFLFYFKRHGGSACARYTSRPLDEKRISCRGAQTPKGEGLRGGKERITYSCHDIGKGKGQTSIPAPRKKRAGIGSLGRHCPLVPRSSRERKDRHAEGTSPHARPAVGREREGGSFYKGTHFHFELWRKADRSTSRKRQKRKRKGTDAPAEEKKAHPTFRLGGKVDSPK